MYYTLTKKQCSPKDFVHDWNEIYPEPKTKSIATGKTIKYYQELSNGPDLTPENIKRLLRWKDPRFLTEKYLSGKKKGENNKRVDAILEFRVEINKFSALIRINENEQVEFKNQVDTLFQDRIFQAENIIWKIFLFHIARPLEYPIADQNVFRAYHELTDYEEPKSWDDYQNKYRNFFFDLAKETGHLKTSEPLEKRIKSLKMVDNALFAFGKFLKTYQRLFDSKTI